MEVRHSERIDLGAHVFDRDLVAVDLYLTTEIYNEWKWRGVNGKLWGIWAERESKV